MLEIHVSGMIGSSPEECAKDLIELAKRLNVIVEMKFNGDLMWAYPSSTVESVLEMFCRLQK